MSSTLAALAGLPPSTPSPTHRPRQAEIAAGLIAHLAHGIEEGVTHLKQVLPPLILSELEQQQQQQQQQAHIAMSPRSSPLAAAARGRASPLRRHASPQRRVRDAPRRGRDSSSGDGGGWVEASGHDADDEASRFASAVGAAPPEAPVCSAAVGQHAAAAAPRPPRRGAHDGGRFGWYDARTAAAVAAAAAPAGEAASVAALAAAAGAGLPKALAALGPEDSERLLGALPGLPSEAAAKEVERAAAEIQDLRSAVEMKLLRIAARAAALEGEASEQARVRQLGVVAKAEVRPASQGCWVGGWVGCGQCRTPNRSSCPDTGLACHVLDAQQGHSWPQPLQRAEVWGRERPAPPPAPSLPPPRAGRARFTLPLCRRRRPRRS
jgi:hypothetical protein